MGAHPVAVAPDVDDVAVMQQAVDQSGGAARCCLLPTSLRSPPWVTSSTTMTSPRPSSTVCLSLVFISLPISVWGVTSVPIDNRLCGENENCAPTPRASIDDMGGRRLAVVIIAPPIYTMAIKVAFDGLGALLVIGQLPATRGRPRWVPGSGAGPSWSIRRSVGREVHGDRLRHRELRCRTVGGHFDVQHGAGNVLRIIVAVTTALSDSWSTGTSPAVP